MAYELRPGSGSLFKNDRKEQPNHADYRGDGALLDGTPIWISAWIKETNAGKKFLSLSFKEKEPRQQQPRQQSGGGGDFRNEGMGQGGSGRLAGNNGDDPFGDDIPFVSVGFW